MIYQRLAKVFLICSDPLRRPGKSQDPPISIGILTEQRKMSAVSYWVREPQERPLYVGITNNLRVRLGQHRNGQGSEFVRKYLVYRSVHVEEIASAQDATARERQIKNWRRAWKIQLIERENPDWLDLSHRL
jgi:putative endonuclease